MSHAKPTVSILITYFNEKELLTECLQSILAQAHQPHEVLIYSDSSPTPPEPYIPMALPCTVIHGQENQGPAFGRNTLMRAATGDYIHFHDSDDWFAPEWSSQITDLVNRGAPDLIVTDVASYSAIGLLSPHVMSIPPGIAPPEIVRFALTGAILVPSLTFKRALGLQIGGYRARTILPQSEDFDFGIRLAANAKSSATIDKSLVCQRIREGSHSKTGSHQVWTSGLKAIELLSHELNTEFRPDLAEAAARIGTNLFAEGNLPAARMAFALARQCGGAVFARRRPGFRWAARVFGQEWAERLAKATR